MRPSTPSSNALSDADRQVRCCIYRHFVTAGEGPTTAALASELNRPVAEVEVSLQSLAAAHAIALAPGSSNIWMAHPFSAIPTPYPVRTERGRYWANCAWDALGIPALLGIDAETPTQCPDCAEPLMLHVRGGRPGPAEAVVHFAVPPRRFWENIGFT